MDGPVFDAMLKTALEEALWEDMAELDDGASVRPSRRQRKRMREMLADPFGYERRQRMDAERPVRRHGSVRWAAAIAVAALLTGTAAGYALGGGQFFQRMFNESPWAKVYGDAADTEQLLELGGSADTPVEAGGLRLSVVDAVSDGQLAMVSVQMTVLEELEEVAPGSLHFQEIEVSPLKGGEERSMGFGLSIRPWPKEENQYLLIFSINDAALEQGGSYRIFLEDLCNLQTEKPQVLLPGTWEVEVTFRPAAVQIYSQDETFTVNGEEWTLLRAAVSPLALTLELRKPEADISLWDLDTLIAPSIRMTGGEIIDRSNCTCGISGGSDWIELTLEFQMPLDVKQIESISVFGQKLTKSH